MKLKLDENLPEALLAELRALNHDVDNVRAERIAGEIDPVVWAATCTRNGGEVATLPTAAIASAEPSSVRLAIVQSGAK